MLIFNLVEGRIREEVEHAQVFPHSRVCRGRHNSFVAIQDNTALIIPQTGEYQEETTFISHIPGRTTLVSLERSWLPSAMERSSRTPVIGYA